MASIATVVTMGFGSFGSVNLLPTMGYGIGGGAATDHATKRLTLIGTSRERLNVSGTSRERYTVSGTSKERLTITGASP